MKSHLTSVVILGLLAGPALAQEKLDLKDQKNRASYSIGADIGGNFKRQDLEINPSALAAGIADAFAGKPQLTEPEMKAALAEFRTNMMAKMEAKQKTDGAKNVKEGEA